MFTVCAAVAVFPIAKVVAAPNALTVVALALNTSNDALPVVILVVIAGLVPNTNAPLPVSSVIAEIKLAEDGVPRKVATPVPRLDKPVPP
jgi:hypothetical protein